MSLGLIWLAVWPALTGRALGADEQLETGDFAKVQSKAESLARQSGGAEHVLIVFDIDNTLLATEESLGSAQWFIWQQNLQSFAPDSPDLIAEDFPSLLRNWEDIISHSRMRLTQDTAPATVSQLGSAGFRFLILSTRSTSLHDVTERGLRANRVDISGHALAMPESPEAIFDPAAGVKIDEEFTPSEHVRFHVSRFRPIYLSEGLCLCDGQNKGLILRLLLRRTTGSVKAVLFVDDEERNTNDVFDALRDDEQIDVTTVRFSAEDGRVHDFQIGDKRRVDRAWQRFQRIRAERAESELQPVN